MHIDRARVPEFGPLREVDLRFDPRLNLVYGRNEAGKTTLLDFLLAQLFRWERRRGTRLATVLGDLDRFGDPSEAEGRIEVRLDGELHEYPGGPSLLHYLNLEHAGLAGLFCVRSGELEFPEKEEGEFWAELKKVLSGLPRGVDSLVESVHREARLTPTGRPSDRGDPGPRTRRDELLARIERLEELEDRLSSAADYEERIARLERRQERLSRAKQSRVATLREELEEARQRLEELPSVSGDRVEAWRDLAAEAERLEADLDRHRKRVREREQEVEAREQDLREAEAEARRARKQVEEVEGRNLAERARSVAESALAGGQGAGRPGALRAGGFLALAAGGGALAAGWTGLLGWGTALLLGAVGLAAAGWLLLRARRRVAASERHEREVRSLRQAVAEAGLDVEELSRLPEEVSRIRRRASEAESRRDLARERLNDARKLAEEAREEAVELEDRRREIAAEVERHRSELGFDALADAREARERCEEQEARVRELRSSLEELAGSDPGAWEVDAPAGEDLPDWDPAEKAEVDDRLAEARQEYRALRDEFVGAGLTAPEDVLTELARCREELHEIQKDWEAGRLAGRIFASMDQGLEDRLAGALARDGELSVGGLARRFTDRYREVRREEDGGIRVSAGGGEEYALEALSRGARDQIYLAVRVGLAGAALETAGVEEGGFLLLDDAFLTADWERRERLVEGTRQLASAGWQVIYLTCDEHLRRLFDEAGARVHLLSEPAA